MDVCVLISRQFVCLCGLILLPIFQLDLNGQQLAAPMNPSPLPIRFKGSWPETISGRAWDVAIADSLAYVSLADGGLLILDTDHSSGLRPVGQFPALGKGPVAVSDGYVYLGANGLQVIQVSNPAQPVRIGGFGGVSIRRLVHKDNRVYAAIEPSGLAVFDVTDKSNPQKIPTDQSNVWSVAVSGNLICVGGSNYFACLEVDGQGQPRFRAALSEWPGKIIWDVAIVGTYALLCHEQGLDAVDISRPEDPTLAGSFPIDWGFANATPGRLLISDRTVYVGGASRLFLIDIADLGAPRLLSRFDLPLANAEFYRTNGGGIRGLHAAGTRVFLALDYDGLQIVDVRNKAEPALNRSYFTYFDLRAIAVSGNTAYALTYPAGLHILDITAPESPNLLGTYSYPMDLGSLADLAVLGSHVFLRENNLGVSVIDVGNPASPVRSTQFLTNLSPSEISFSVSQNRAVTRTDSASSGQVSFQLWDLSDASQPVSLNAFECQSVLIPSTCGFPGPLFWGRDRYLFLWQDGLHTFDIEMPGVPVPIGFLPIEGSFETAFAFGDIAFVAGECVLMFDTGDPQAPRLMGCVYTNGVRSLALRGRYAAATDALGLKILDLQDPAQAGIVGRYDSTGFGQMALAGSHALIAHGTRGLTILSLGEAFDSKPSILLQPRGRRVVPGQTARFEVAAEGTVPLQYQWRLDDSAIPAATNAILTLLDIEPGQAGSYSVLVSNPLGIAVSSGAILEVDASPQVRLALPTPHTIFLAPATIAVAADAVDVDGAIAQVKFFEGTNEIGTVHQPPFALSWTGVLPGVYSLTALAVDVEGASTRSEPVSFTVTNTPVFYWSRPVFEIPESNGVAVVVIRRNSSDGPASVRLNTADGTARAVTESGRGDYSGLATNVNFSSGDSKAAVRIPIANDLVYRGRRSFSLILSQPSEGWALAAPAQASVDIEDDDSPLTTNSFNEVVFPAPAPTERGSLQIILEPPEALGAWRFSWESTWRQSDIVAQGLVPGNYPVTFRPRLNFLPPEPAEYTVAPDTAEVATNFYTYAGSAAPAGSLIVTLTPSVVAAAVDPARRGQWRLQGEISWHDSGWTFSAVPSGDHIVEFKPIDNFQTPSPRTVSVAPNQTSLASVQYLLETPSPGLAPTPLPGYASITNGLNAGLPYAFSGQLHSDVGFGSGFVVKKRTVLTSAHLVFNAATLSHVGNVDWFFQRHRDQFETPPQSPRGWYLFQGYAAARTNDLTVLGYSPNESSTESFALDVAALYFREDAGRGGYGGYLVSYGDDNDWLLRPALKLLVGYPVEDVAPENAGKMHRAGPDYFWFERIRHPLFRTEDIRGFLGNQGGALCVQTKTVLGQTFFIPAALYLNASSQSILRVIDLDAVDLINRADSSSYGGNHTTGGGTINVVTAQGSDPHCIGWVMVELGPESAVAAGAKWRVSPTNQTPSIYTNFTAVPQRIYTQPYGGTMTIELAAVPGFVLPSNQNVTVFCDQGALIQPRYTVVPPWLGFMDRTTLVATGTPATSYALEYRDVFAPPEPWISIATNTLGPGTNVWLQGIPAEPRTRYYRARWIP